MKTYKLIFISFILLIILCPFQISAKHFIPQDRDDFEQFKTHLKEMTAVEIIKERINYTQEQQQQFNIFLSSLTDEERKELETIEEKITDEILSQLSHVIFNIIIKLPIFFLIITIILWLIFGYSRNIVDVVNFYPPKNINSLEAGYIYKGYVDMQQISSLLIYLSNMGYLTVSKIKFKDEKQFGFKIIKLKEYDGQNSIEKKFMELLFQTENIKKTSEITITESELVSTNEKNFVTTFTTRFRPLLSYVNNDKKLKKILKKSTIVTIISVFIIVSMICIIYPPLIFYSDQNPFGMVITFAIGYLVLANAIMSKDKGSIYYTIDQRPTTGTFKHKFVITLLIVLVFMGPSTYIILTALMKEPLYILWFVIGFVCIIIMTYFVSIFPKITKYGEKIYAEVKGFKRFLETVEKDRLEALYKEDLEHFYKIFSYAFALDITSIWDEKYSSITNQIPTTFTREPYSIVDLGAFMSILNKKN